MPHRFHVVPTSHWDREWYLPFERFRAWLVEALDDVLGLLDRHPEYRFTLDGQSILLDDYLEVRPEREPRVRELVAAGRLITGPWYVQPDEFLVSGESLARNLERGRELARGMGGSMECGYVPDSFGHVADLPGILAGQGIHTAVFARGAGDDAPAEAELFWWRSPGGQRVLAHKYPLGYGLGAGLSRDPEQATRQLGRVGRDLTRRCKAPEILLPAGSDHSRPQPQLPIAVAALDREEGPWLFSSHDGYFAALEPGFTRGLPEYRGELRGASDAPLLSGTLSARLYLKQRNFQLEHLLTRHVEPAALFARQAGMPDQDHLLRVAWAELLKNHPHDSICGCSVDAVHQEMETRFARAEQVAAHVLSRSLEHLGKHTAPPAQGALGKLILLSCEGHPGPAQVQASLRLSRAELARAMAPDAEAPLCLSDGDSSHPVQVLGHRTRKAGVMGGAIRDLPQWLEQLADRHPVRDYTCSVDGDLLRVEVDEGPAAACAEQLTEEALALAREPGLERVEIHLHRSDLRVAAALDRTPALGFSTVSLAPGDALAGGAVADLDGLRNEHLRLRVSVDGLAVEHLATGWELEGLHRLLDVADRGDTYNFSPLPGDRPLEARLVSWEVVEPGPVRATLRLRYMLAIPASLTPDRSARARELVDHEICTDVSLWRDCPRIDFHTRLHNRSRDHRLRVAFPLGLEAATVHADSAFSVVERPRDPGTSEAGPERQVDAHPMREFVDLSDGQRGAALMARGLSEYGSERGDSTGGLALTLVRAVGMLALDDLPERPGLAGPPYETPGAQCPGEHALHYALLMHAGGWRQGQVARQARAFCHPPLVALAADGTDGSPTGGSLGNLPRGWWVTSLRATPDGGARLRAVNSGEDPLRVPGPGKGEVPPWGIADVVLDPGQEDG